MKAASALYRPASAKARSPSDEAPKRSSGGKFLAFIIGLPLALVGLPILLVAAVLYPVAMILVGISAQVIGRLNVYLGAAALRVLPSDMALRALPMVALNGYSGSYYKLSVRIQTILMAADEWGIIDNLITPTKPGPRIPKTMIGGLLLALWYVFNLVDTLVTHLIEFPVEFTRQFIGQQGLRLMPVGFASKVEVLGKPVSFGEDWYSMLFENEDGLNNLDQMFGLMSLNMQLATTATLMEVANMRGIADDRTPADVALIHFFEDSDHDNLRCVASMVKDAQYERFDSFE